MRRSCLKGSNVQEHIYQIEAILTNVNLLRLRKINVQLVIPIPHPIQVVMPTSGNLNNQLNSTCVLNKRLILPCHCQYCSRPVEDTARQQGRVHTLRTKADTRHTNLRGKNPRKAGSNLTTWLCQNNQCFIYMKRDSIINCLSCPNQSKPVSTCSIYRDINIVFQLDVNHIAGRPSF